MSESGRLRCSTATGNRGSVAPNQGFVQRLKIQADPYSRCRRAERLCWRENRWALKLPPVINLRDESSTESEGLNVLAGAFL